MKLQWSYLTARQNKKTQARPHCGNCSVQLEATPVSKLAHNRITSAMKAHWDPWVVIWFKDNAKLIIKPIYCTVMIVQCSSATGIEYQGWEIRKYKNVRLLLFCDYFLLALPAFVHGQDINWQDINSVQNDTRSTSALGPLFGTFSVRGYEHNRVNRRWCSDVRGRL